MSEIDKAMEELNVLIKSHDDAVIEYMAPGNFDAMPAVKTYGAIRAFVRAHLEAEQRAQRQARRLATILNDSPDCPPGFERTRCKRLGADNADKTCAACWLRWAAQPEGKAAP